jgi:hypothetical protein
LLLESPLCPIDNIDATSERDMPPLQYLSAQYIRVVLAFLCFDLLIKISFSPTLKADATAPSTSSKRKLDLSLERSFCSLLSVRFKSGIFEFFQKPGFPFQFKVFGRFDFDRIQVDVPGRYR